MKKIVLVLIFLLCFCSMINARELYKHTIDIQPAGNGFALITEKYYFYFSNQIELEQFRNESIRLGPSLPAWNVFDENIFAHIGKSQNDVTSGIVSFEEKEEGKFVKLEYQLTSPIFEISADSLRETEWKLNERNFYAFESGGTIVLPKNTSISLTIPANAEIIGVVSPEGTIEGKTIKWQGFLNINEINLTYLIKKPIAPPLDTSKLIWELINSIYIWVIAVIVLIIAALLYWKKEQISKKIEHYLVEHSQFEPAEDEEEIEIKFD